MATAFQKIYMKIGQITKATVSLKAKGVGYDELATINGKLAQVVKIAGDDVTLQVFEGTGGIPTNAEVVFLGKAPSLKVGEQLAGRFFNAYGNPIDGGPEIEGKEVPIGGPSVNPVRRKQPSELIATGTFVATPDMVDPDYNDLFLDFALMGHDEFDPTLEYEITPTVDYPILVVLDNYNDEGMENLKQFTTFCAYDWA